MPTKLITVLCTAVLISFTTPVAAAETNVSEAFGCNFIAGKTMADLDAATQYYVAERSKIESPALQKMVSRIWTPVLGNVPVDFVWFNTNLTYAEWGAMRDANNASSVGTAIQARFDAVATCPGSALIANEELFSNLATKPFKEDGSVMVESFRCTLHPGKSMGASDAAVAIWKPIFTKAVAATGASAVVMRRVPLISGAGFDVSYLVAWDDNAAYAAGNEAFRADPGSAKSDAAFNTAHRCQSALFSSRTVVPPPS